MVKVTIHLVDGTIQHRDLTFNDLKFVLEASNAIIRLKIYFTELTNLDTNQKVSSQNNWQIAQEQIDDLTNRFNVSIIKTASSQVEVGLTNLSLIEQEIQPLDNLGFFNTYGISIDDFFGLILKPQPEPEPTEPKTEINSFTQKVIAIEYKTTSLGKSLFLQIQLTKVKDYPFDNVTAILKIKNQAKQNTLVEQKTVSVKGVNARSIVWEISDIPNATAVMFVDHLVGDSSGILGIVNEIKDIQVIINETGSSSGITGETETKTKVEVKGTDYLKILGAGVIGAYLIKTFGGKP